MKLKVFCCSSNSLELVMWVLVHAILNLFSLAFNIIAVLLFVFRLDAEESEDKDCKVVGATLLSVGNSVQLNHLFDGCNKQAPFERPKATINKFWVFSFKHLHEESADGPDQDFVAVVAEISLLFHLLWRWILSWSHYMIAESILIGCGVKRLVPLITSRSSANRDSIAADLLKLLYCFLWTVR